MLETGRTIEELQSIVKTKSSIIQAEMLKLILKDLIEDGKIKIVDNTYSSIDHHVNLLAKDEKDLKFVENYFKNLVFTYA